MLALFLLSRRIPILLVHQVKEIKQCVRNVRLFGPTKNQEIEEHFMASTSFSIVGRNELYELMYCTVDSKLSEQISFPNEMPKVHYKRS